MEDIENKFILSKRLGCYRTYLRRIGRKEYHISGNIELAYVLKGQIFINQEDKTYRLDQGELFIIGPNKDVLVQPSSRDNTVLILQLFPACLEEVNLYKASPVYTGLVLNTSRKDRMVSNIRILLKHKLGSKFTEDIIIRVLESLVGDISLNFPLVPSPKDSNRDIRDIIVDITRDLRGRLLRGEDTSLRAVSQDYGVSYYYLSKKFKAVTGETYTDYLANIQMNIFLDMLINTDMTITNIALNSGYKNISNLNKDFKKYFNMSPTRLRKVYQVEKDNPTFKIREVKDFLDQPSSLEDYYLNDEIVIDFIREGEFTDRSMTQEDISQSLVRMKEFLSGLRDVKVNMVVDLADYGYVLRDKTLLLSLSDRVAEVVDLCLLNNIALSVNYKLS